MEYNIKQIKKGIQETFKKELEKNYKKLQEVEIGTKEYRDLLELIKFLTDSIEELEETKESSFLDLINRPTIYAFSVGLVVAIVWLGR